MYSAELQTKTLNIKLLAETNKNGYIDFNANLAAFKVYILNSEDLDESSITYKWSVKDSSGQSLDQDSLTIYQNSLGIPTSLIERSNVYTVEANVSSNGFIGFTRTDYQTEPDMSFEFRVQPAIGEAHSTNFVLMVTSQAAFEDIITFVFGYVDPQNSDSLIPLYQRSINKYLRAQLPSPGTASNLLTCYVTVMAPNGVGKTYF